MQLKLREIVANVENIKSLLNNKLPVKIAYKLNKLSGKLDKELVPYSETKNKLILELGEKQENGETSITDTEKKAEFFKKNDELLETEVEIEFDPIKIEDLGDITVAPNELVSWIFE